jgi:hypothetical protein
MERVGRFIPFIPASCTGAISPEMFPAQDALMAIIPIDQQGVVPLFFQGIGKKRKVILTHKLQPSSAYVSL